MALHDMRIRITWRELAAEWAAVLPLNQINQPRFPEKKTQKEQIKKLSSILQITPKLTPKCCIILNYVQT